MKIELCCTTSTLINEIANPKIKKVDVAQTYRLALESSEQTDWMEVNTAIISRWSRSALKDIKNWAWSGKCFVDRGVG